MWNSLTTIKDLEKKYGEIIDTQASVEVILKHIECKEADIFEKVFLFNRFFDKNILLNVKINKYILFDEVYKIADYYSSNREKFSEIFKYFINVNLVDELFEFIYYNIINEPKKNKLELLELYNRLLELYSYIIIKKSKNNIKLDTTNFNLLRLKIFNTLNIIPKYQHQLNEERIQKLHFVIDIINTKNLNNAEILLQLFSLLKDNLFVLKLEFFNLLQEKSKLLTYLVKQELFLYDIITADKIIITYFLILHILIKEKKYNKDKALTELKTIFDTNKIDYHIYGLLKLCLNK